MYFGHINNFKALLAAPVTASGTTIELKSGADKIAEVLERDSRVALTLFASDGRGGDLKREVVHATEVNGAAVTVIRGQEGTEAKEFFTDEGVEARLTAKGLDDFAHDDIVIIGSSSVLQGQAGVAIGKDVILGRENGVTEQLGTSIAIGLRATIRALNSIAVGEDATVDVSGGLSGVGDALALGRASRVTFQKSMAIGLRAECNSTDSVAMGTDAKTSGAGSLALGSQAETEFAQFSVALGHMAKASQNAAVAVGDQAKAESQEAIALGLFSTTRGHKSVSIGSESLVDVPGHIQTDVLNGRAVAVGERSTVTAEGGVAVGSDARANGTAALAVGRATRATGDHSIAVGSGANTASFEAIAIGRGG